jgi:hypothetical protein
MEWSPRGWNLMNVIRMRFFTSFRMTKERDPPVEPEDDPD